MPRIDGLELTALIKANGYQETKVIVFTEAMATEKQVQIAGADVYVTKNAPLSELRAAVSRLCQSPDTRAAEAESLSFEEKSEGRALPRVADDLHAPTV